MEIGSVDSDTDLLPGNMQSLHPKPIPTINME